jgi:hypothetical protein
VDSPPSLDALELDAWEAAEGKPEQDLIRLSILRRLSRVLHADFSRAMATGLSREFRDKLAKFDVRIDGFARLSPLPSSFSRLLDDDDVPSPPSVSPRTLPMALFAVLPKESIERFDRRWERELLAEALFIGGGLWTLEARIPAIGAADFQDSLERRLFPYAYSLFVETLGFRDPMWHGRWFLAARPGMDWSILDTQTTGTPELLFGPAVG